jgi:hypothetical protein
MYGKRTRIFGFINLGSRLVYVAARLLGQLAFGFFALTTFLVSHTPLFIGLGAFTVNPLPQIEQIRT